MATFIESLLERLLATSVQAALLVAVIWILCRLVPRLPPAAQCWLWWLAALQVLAGLVATPVLLPWLPQAGANGPMIAPAADLDLAAAGPAAPVVAGTASLAWWQMTAFTLWLTGIAVTTWATARDWRGARRLMAEAVPCTDPAVLAAVAQAAAGSGLHRLPRLFTTFAFDSPAIVGGFRPALLLPARFTLSGVQLEMAVAHELEHLRRRDLWWGIVPALARHVLFFHPLVHLAVREYGMARETACDAAVVRSGQRSRREYGELLVKLGTAQSSASLAAASPTFRVLSWRLSLLQNVSFLPRALSMLVLLIVVAGVLPVRLVAAAADAPVASMQAAAPTAQATAPSPQVVAPRAQAAAPPAQVAAQRTQAASPSPQAAAPPSARARLLFRPDANDYYPSESRSAGEEGTVEVRMCYSAEGLVVESTLATSSGFTRLDEAAVRMAHRYRFSPVIANGAALPDCVVMPVRFPGPFHPDPRYTGERMSGNFQQIPVRTLLLLIAETSGRNIEVSDSVSGSVTLRVDNVPWDQILDIVLRIKGLEKHMRGDTIVVAAADAKGGGAPE